MRIETKIGLISLSVIIIAAACGGRSGTEIFGYEDRLADSGSGGVGGSGGYGGGIVGGAGGTTAGTGGDVTGGSGGDAGTGGDGGSGGDGGTGGDIPDADVPDVSEDAPVDAVSDAQDFFDTLPPIPDGALGDCVSCLQDECGDQINACYNDPTCVEGIQCTVTDCLAGSGSGGSGGSAGGVDFQCVLGCFDNDIGSAMTAMAAFQCVTESCSDDCGLGSGGAGGGSGGGFGGINGMNMPPVLFGQYGRAFGQRGHYIGTTRVPRPEEVASAYPWLAEVLAGRMPDPLPPCIVKKRANP